MMCARGNPKLSRLLVLCALLTLLSPFASSSPSIVDLEAQSIQSVGSNQADGNFVFLVQEITHSEQDAGQPKFKLIADRIHVETDHTDTYANVRFNEHSSLAETQDEDFEDATVLGLEHRGFYKFVLAAAEENIHVNVKGHGCSAAISPTGNQVGRGNHVMPTRTDLSARTGDSLLWQGCQGSEVTVIGDLVLQLWNWDAQLTTADGHEELLWSGPDPTVDDPTGVGLVVGRAQEQFLYAYNATLTVPVLTGNYLLYVEDASLEASGGFNIRGATGNLGGGDGIELEDQDLFVQGDLDLRLRGNGVLAPFSVSMVGALERVEVDGVEITASIVRPGNDALPGSTLIWISAFVATLAAVAVAWARPSLYYHFSRGTDGRWTDLQPRTWRQRRGIGYGLMAYAASKKRRFRDCYRRAKRALHEFPGLAEAMALQGLAAGRIGRVGECSSVLDEARTLLSVGRDRADVCIAAAEACVRNHRSQEAIKWLKLGFEDDPLHVLDQAARPVFDPLGVNGWVRMIRRGAGPGSASTLRASANRGPRRERAD